MASNGQGRAWRVPRLKLFLPLSHSAGCVTSLCRNQGPSFSLTLLDLLYRGEKPHPSTLECPLFWLSQLPERAQWTPPSPGHPRAILAYAAPRETQAWLQDASGQV